MWKHHDLVVGRGQPFCPALALLTTKAVDLLHYTPDLLSTEALKATAPIYVVLAAVVVWDHR
jgi:hypothetical protein